jgi:HTH-type transcriptional regulator/antitoxin HigA
MAVQRLKEKPVEKNLKSTIKHWGYVSRIIHEPQNDAEYDRLVQLLDRLLDIVDDDENHKLMGLVDVISHVIEKHDEREGHYVKATSGIEALRFLMEQHHLKQSDLPEIGSQGVVSEILQGKRKLNLSQVKKLSERFHVSLETFVD